MSVRKSSRSWSRRVRTFSYDSSEAISGMVTNGSQKCPERLSTDCGGNDPTRGWATAECLSFSPTRKRNDFFATLDQVFDLERFRRAMGIVQEKVSPHNWQAFVLTELDGRSIAETAALLSVDKATVYVAGARFIRC